MKIILLLFSSLWLALSPVHSLFRIKRFHTDALKIQNYARFLHDTVPLTLSISLCDKANQSAANILEQMQLGFLFPKLKKSVHSVGSSAWGHYLDMVGENAWTKPLTGPYEDDIDENGSVSVMEAIRDWYSEMANFKWTEEDNPSAEYFDSIQGFAQIVWNTTLKVGCGDARDSDKIVIVCCYHPMAILSNAKLLKLHVPKRVHGKEFSIPEFSIVPDIPAVKGEEIPEVPVYDWMGTVEKL